MTRLSTACAFVACGVLGAAAGWLGHPRTAALAQSSAQPLDARLAALEATVRRHEDVEEIYNLQSIYGYYLDKRMWDEVADLFTTDAVVEIGGRGVYRGTGVRTLFKDVMGAGTSGPRPGVLNNHLQLQPVVHVAADGRTAKGRWRAFAQVAQVGRAAIWSEGPYEIDYRKVDGKWMFATLRWDPTYYTPFDRGWDKAVEQSAGGGSTQTNAKFPPDSPPSRPVTAFPAVGVLPFHYKHPITGK